MDFESEDAWLRDRISAMSRSEIVNYSRKLSWTGWWIMQSTQHQWVMLSDSFFEINPADNTTKWFEHPDAQNHRN